MVVMKHFINNNWTLTNRILRYQFKSLININHILSYLLYVCLFFFELSRFIYMPSPHTTEAPSNE